MVKVSQNKPKLHPERGLGGMMLWNVLCFFFHTSRYKSLQTCKKSHENLWSKAVFFSGLLFCQDIHYKCLMFIGHL